MKHKKFPLKEKITALSELIIYSKGNNFNKELIKNYELQLKNLTIQYKKEIKERKKKKEVFKFI